MEQQLIELRDYFKAMAESCRDAVPTQVMSDAYKSIGAAEAYARSTMKVQKIIEQVQQNENK